MNETGNTHSLNRYKIVRDIYSKLPYPTEDYVRKVILNKNDCFIVCRDFDNNFIVSCKNKPRNLPIFGIEFIKINKYG